MAQGVGERDLTLADSRADGAQRRVRLERERVRVRRTVAGVEMRLDVAVAGYQGVALAPNGDGFQIVLAHRDPDLAVELAARVAEGDAVAAWRDWAAWLARPRLIRRLSGELVDCEHLFATPSLAQGPYRPTRRPRPRAPRRLNWTPAPTRSLAGAREMIARDER